jgi:hypothetical protein
MEFAQPSQGTRKNPIRLLLYIPTFAPAKMLTIFLFIGFDVAPSRCNNTKIDYWSLKFKLKLADLTNFALA